MWLAKNGAAYWGKPNVFNQWLTGSDMNWNIPAGLDLLLG